MQVFFYQTAAGHSPIKRFIDSLPEEDQARFIEVFQEIEKRGLAAVRLVFKQIEGKLWEINSGRFIRATVFFMSCSKRT